jgi:hypothetical protein
MRGLVDRSEIHRCTTAARAAFDAEIPVDLDGMQIWAKQGALPWRPAIPTPMLPQEFFPDNR